MIKLKKIKSKSPLKKDTGAKILRFVLWGMLVFLTVRGAISIIRPDQTDTLKTQMKKVETETKKNVERNSEVLAFAQNFAKEWYTYTTEEEFKARVTPYIVPDLLSLQYLHDFTSTSIVTNVNAYRIQEYSKGQYNVFVLCEYTNTRMEETVEESETTDKKKAKTEEAVKQTPITTKSTRILQVPVQSTENGRYIIEGIPLVVSDPEYLPDKYTKLDIEIDKIEDVTLYQETISNYLKAYYGDTRSVTDYFLASDSDREKLYGFSEPGEVEFIAVNEVKAYRSTKNEVLCLVTYQIRDIASQAVSLQQCNIRLDDSESGRLYVKDMETKTFNLKEEK